MSKETEICREVYAEIKRSNGIHGEQLDRPLGCDKVFEPAARAAKISTDTAFQYGTLTWMHIAHEEALECFAEEDLDKIRTEAIQAAAMFAKMALACDHQKDKGNPLTIPQRVTHPDYGKGTIQAIDPEGGFGPTAWIFWDDRQAVQAYDLDWARKLERLDGSSEAL